MDPRIEPRATCLVCDAPLRPPKSRFCSLICSNRHSRRNVKFAYVSDFEADFVAKVKKPISLRALATALGVDEAEAERQARERAAAGKLKLWVNDDELAYVGIPIPKEQRPPLTPEQQEADLRERKRAKNRRYKARRRAREAAA